MPRQNTPGIGSFAVPGQPESASVPAAFHTDNGFTALPKQPHKLPALMRYGRLPDHDALSLFLSLAEKFTFRPQGRTIVTPCGHAVHIAFGQAFVTQTELARDATRSRGYAYHKLKTLEKDGHIEMTPVYPPGNKRAVGTIVVDKMGIIRDFLGFEVNQSPNRSSAPLNPNQKNASDINLDGFAINGSGVPKTDHLKEQSIPSHHPSGEKNPALPVLESPRAASAPDPAATSFSQEDAQEAESVAPSPDFADPAAASLAPEEDQEGQESENKKPGKKKKPSPYSPQKRQAATKRKKQRRAAAAKRTPKPNSSPKKLPPSIQRLREVWEAEGLHLSDRPTQGYHAGPTINACLQAIDHAGHTQPLVHAIARYAAKLRSTGKLKPYAQSFQNFFFKNTWLDFLPQPEPEPVQQARQMLYEAFGPQHRNVADDIAISVHADAQGLPFYRFKGGDLFQLIVPAQRHLLASLPLDRIQWDCCAGANTAQRVLDDLEYGYFDDTGAYHEFPTNADDPSLGPPIG